MLGLRTALALVTALLVHFGSLVGWFVCEIFVSFTCHSFCLCHGHACCCIAQFLLLLVVYSSRTPACITHCGRDGGPRPTSRDHPCRLPGTYLVCLFSTLKCMQARCVHVIYLSVCLFSTLKCMQARCVHVICLFVCLFSTLKCKQACCVYVIAGKNSSRDDCVCSMRKKEELVSKCVSMVKLISPI